MQNYQRTIISQYANSPTLKQLIANFNEYIDPRADLDAFYSYVFNIETAQGFGLDIWGKIVDVVRYITIPTDTPFFGFKEGTNYQPFGQAPFYSIANSTGTYALSDDAFRTLILVKALSNISNCTSQSYNQLLQNLFAGRGRCYVDDLGSMQMQFVFEFALLPYELSILTQSGAIPRPAGVKATVLQIDIPHTFGFREAGIYQPFGYGVFGSIGEYDAA